MASRTKINALQNRPFPPAEQLVRKRREIKEVFSFAKHHMVGHLTVNAQNSCRFHCVNHALGDCKEEHPDTCFECGKLHRFGENLNRFHQVWSNLLCRAHEDHLPSFRKSHGPRLQLRAQ